MRANEASAGGMRHIGFGSPIAEPGTGLSSLAAPMSFMLFGQAASSSLRFAARSLALCGAVAVSAFLIAPRPAYAVMVGTTPNAPPDTSMNPGDSGSGWAHGDPGWANAGRGDGVNGVYIGDGWMLGVYHAVPSAVQFVDAGPTYSRIPNQLFVVPNPAGYAGLTEQYADLVLYRINADPGLQALNIASQPLVEGNEVMFISYGHYRESAETRWSINTSTNPHTWTSPSSCSLNLGMDTSTCRRGYQSGGIGKRWGTNHIERDDVVFGSSPPHNDANITVKVSLDSNHATIANMTVFNHASSNPFEAQVVNQDSGSGVFYKRDGQWELAGIATNIFVWNGQNSYWAVYGDASAIADLSSYYSQIEAIKAAHADYSIVGDVNLDGVVTDADISTFVANWGYDNGLGIGSITTWKLGDLTRDGKVDVYDFFKWRNGASGSAAALGSLLGLGGESGGSVPEPAVLLPSLVAAALAFLSRRRHRS